MDAADLSPAFLEAHRIPGLPRSFYYIPNLITEAEEELLLSKVKPSLILLNIASVPLHSFLPLNPVILPFLHFILLHSQHQMTNTPPQK